MNKFIKGDRVWVLAEVVFDQHEEDRIAVGVIMPSGVKDTTSYADARKARMETPLLEVGMWVNIGMTQAQIVARDGEYLWLKRQTGSMQTAHISAISHRRDGPRSMEPVPEPETPPVIVHKHTAIAGVDHFPSDTFKDNSKAEWWNKVDVSDGDKMTREEFDAEFPGASLSSGVGGWTMVTPKGCWHLPAGTDTVWTYSDEIPF